MKRARLCVMGAATARTPTLGHRAPGYRRRGLLLRLARVLALRGRVSSGRRRMLWHTRAVCPLRVRRSRPRSPSTVSEGEVKGGVRLPNAHALPGASPRQAPLKYPSRRRPPVRRPPPRQASPPAPEEHNATPGSIVAADNRRWVTLLGGCVGCRLSSIMGGRCRLLRPPPSSAPGEAQ